MYKTRAESLTHALCPKSDEIWLGRRPGTRQHGVQGAGQTLNDTEASDAGRHRAEGGGCECDGRKMTDGHNGSNYKGIFKQVRTGYMGIRSRNTMQWQSIPKNWEGILEQDPELIPVNLGGALRVD